MLDHILSILAPHRCYSCGKIADVLCENCKYNITSEPYGCCIICLRPTAALSTLCRDCKSPYERAWCVGERSSGLEDIIDAFKFYNVKAAHRPLALLLHETLPELPDNTVIVPIPTVASHVRQRGYDHMLLVSRELAHLRNLPLMAPLERVTSATQRGANKKLRHEQAKTAFTCRQPLDPDTHYLLVDDVVTTGATMHYGAKTLRAAGASSVWVAAISRQPIDNS